MAQRAEVNQCKKKTEKRLGKEKTGITGVLERVYIDYK